MIIRVHEKKHALTSMAKTLKRIDPEKILKTRGSNHPALNIKGRASSTPLKIKIERSSKETSEWKFNALIANSPRTFQEDLKRHIFFIL